MTDKKKKEGKIPKCFSSLSLVSRTVFSISGMLKCHLGKARHFQEKRENASLRTKCISLFLNYIYSIYKIYSSIVRHLDEIVERVGSSVVRTPNSWTFNYSTFLFFIFITSEATLHLRTYTTYKRTQKNE